MDVRPGLGLGRTILERCSLLRGDARALDGGGRFHRTHDGLYRSGTGRGDRRRDLDLGRLFTWHWSFSFPLNGRRLRLDRIGCAGLWRGDFAALWLARALGLSDRLGGRRCCLSRFANGLTHRFTGRLAS